MTGPGPGAARWFQAHRTSGVVLALLAGVLGGCPGDPQAPPPAQGAQPVESGSTAAAALPAASATPLLQDLPEQVTDLLVSGITARTLAQAQLALLDHALHEYPLSAAERALTQGYRDHVAALLAGSQVVPAGDLELPAHRFTLNDPAPVFARTARLAEALKSQGCAPLQPLQPAGPVSADQDLHNFLVFYVRNVHGYCGEPVTWAPASGDADVTGFYDLVGDRGQAYKRLRAYLSNANNAPFQRDEAFYIALYFDYLDLSFRARETNLVLREFLIGRPELRARFPEMEWLAWALDRGQKGKLWN